MTGPRARTRPPSLRRASMMNICYHGIGTPARDLEPGEARYWITEDAFERTLDEIASWPGRVAISFDDGNLSDVEIALPALRARGLSAAFFALAGRIDHPGSVGADGLRELVASGMFVGTHGMSHRPWPGLTDDELATELVVAREHIETAIRGPVIAAALPLGRYDRRTLDALKGLGYRRVYSSDQAPAHPHAWFQARYSVTDGDTPATLRERVLYRQGRRHHLRGRLNTLRKRVR